MGIKFRNILEKDLDDVFSYSSTVQINIRSPTLSLFKLGGQILVTFLFVYQVHFVNQNFILKKNFYETQVTKGYASVQTVGTGLVNKNSNFTEALVWDQFDNCIISDNEIFIGLRLTYSIRKIDWGIQKKSTCPNINKKCNSNNQCSVSGGEQCVDGFCTGPNWCSIDVSKIKTIEYDYSQFHFWLRSKITFDSLYQSSTFLLSVRNAYEYQDNVNSFVPLNFLLDQIPVIKPKLLAGGGVISVNIMYSCMIPINCQPTFATQYVEFPLKTQYSMTTGNLIFDGNSVFRNGATYEGIRIIFNVEGIGMQFSTVKIVFLITQFLAVLLLPKFIADLVFTNFMPGLFFQLESAMYRNAKFEIVPAKIIDEIKLKEKISKEQNQKQKKKDDLKKTMVEDKDDSEDEDLLSSEEEKS